MITTDAAGIAGLGSNLGLLAAGRPADVLVLARRHPDPWESAVASLPADVELVTIGGDLAYGRADWISTLAPAGATEPIIGWAGGCSSTRATASGPRPARRRASPSSGREPDRPVPAGRPDLRLNPARTHPARRAGRPAQTPGAASAKSRANPG